MDQPESVILLLSWKSTMTSLGKLIRSERLFWWYRVWNINHCSYREEKYICICIFPLPQTSHLTKEEYTGSKTIFCLPIDKIAGARPTYMTLQLRMKKSGYRPTPWENKNSPSRPIRCPGSQLSSLAQRAIGSGGRIWRRQVHQLLHLPKPFPRQGPGFHVEQHLMDFVFHWLFSCLLKSAKPLVSTISYGNQFQCNYALPEMKHIMLLFLQSTFWDTWIPP